MGRLAMFAAVLVCAGCVKRPPPTSDFLKSLAQQGYEPNPGLAGTFQPGNIIQTTELGPDGRPRPLQPPLVFAWASECFPDVRPHTGAYAISADSAQTERSIGVEGPELRQLLPTLKLQVGAVSEHRMRLKNPHIRALSRGEISGKLSEECVASLARAFREGDRPEWFAVILESLVVDGLTLEIKWASSATAELKKEILEDAAQTLESVPPDEDGFVEPAAAGAKPKAIKLGRVAAAATDATTSVVNLTSAATVGYRVRPLRAVHEQLPASSAAGPTPAGAPAAGLRDRFEAASPGSPVARLTVRDLSTGTPRRVRVDHPFRSGDAFQLEVTSSRAGWLYLLHATPGEPARALWPPPGAGDDNAVRPGEAAVIPPPPAHLRFDDRAGPELLYVVIRQERQPPRLGATPPAATQLPAAAGRPAYLAPAAAASGSGEIVQFSVRSPSGGSVRAVVYDPGTGDPDPALYFAAPPGDPQADAVLEFRLVHAP